MLARVTLPALLRPSAPVVLLLLLALGFGSVAPCQARLNETVAQCGKRYGAPVKTGAAQPPIERELRYVYKNWRITVQAIGDKVVEIAYLRLPSQPVFTEDDLAAILKEEKAGSEWDDNGSEKIRLWRRRSDAARAILHDGRAFVITSIELQEMEDKMEKGQVR